MNSEKGYTTKTLRMMVGSIIIVLSFMIMGCSNAGIQKDSEVTQAKETATVPTSTQVEPPSDMGGGIGGSGNKINCLIYENKDCVPFKQ